MDQTINDKGEQKTSSPKSLPDKLAENQPTKVQVQDTKTIAAKDSPDTTELLQRVQADFENYIKRVDKEKSEVKRATSERMITKLLNTLDDFERAFEHLKQGCSHEDFVKGMTLVFTHFQKMLVEEGLKPVKASGKANPYEHEVLLQEESKNIPEGTILQELQKGYALNGRLLRSAKVKVAKTQQTIVSTSSVPSVPPATQGNLQSSSGPVIPGKSPQ